MKKELLLLGALTLGGLGYVSQQTECTGPVDHSWNRRDFDPIAMSCETNTGHIIYMRDGKEYFTKEDYESFTLGIELKEGIMVHTQNENIYRGFLYNPETNEMRQEYCVMSNPFNYC